MRLEGRSIRLRAMEPEDLERLYLWENDIEVWSVSGTTSPFSRTQLEEFILAQRQADVFRTGQLRLIVERSRDGEAIGAVDLFEVEPLHKRAGIGILIHGAENRRHGYAADTLSVVCRYAREFLGLHQIWCGIATDNEASMRLFRRAGFEPVGIKRDWLWSPEGYRDEALLQKIL